MNLTSDKFDKFNIISPDSAQPAAYFIATNARRLAVDWANDRFAYGWRQMLFLYLAIASLMIFPVILRGIS